MANYINIKGNAFDVKVRQTKNGGEVVSFVLSFYGRKDKEGTAVYGSLPVYVFGRLADAWNGKIHDRDRLIVSGRLSAETWEKDGVKRYSTPIIADSISRPERVEWQPQWLS